MHLVDIDLFLYIFYMYNINNITLQIETGESS